jgi:hypothetical protein
MKRPIINGIAFIMPLIILAYPLDLVISSNLKKSNWFASGEYLSWNDIYNGEINSEIVIYGSSKAWTGINPRTISEGLNMTCYNLGIDGHNFWLEYLRHLELLEHNPKPEVIIVSVDALNLHIRDDLYNYEQFLPYMLNNDNITYYTSIYEGFLPVEYKIPLIRYLGEGRAATNALINLIAIDSSEPVRYKGFRANDYEWNEDFDIAKEQMDSYYVELDSASISLFDKFLCECESVDIDVVFVYIPDYYEGQEFISNRHEIVRLYQIFADKYNIPFLDYSSDPMCMQKKYFYNASHLNLDGTIVFNRKFVADLKELEEIKKNM